MNINIETTANLIVENENSIEELENSINELKKKNNDLESNLIENLEDEGISIGTKVTTSNGKVVTFKEKYTANIPAKTTIDKCKDENKREDLIIRREEAFNWLKNNGYSSVISDVLIIDADKECIEEAEELLEKNSIEYKVEEKVHSSTLNALAKNIMESGEKFPTDTFGVFVKKSINIK